MISGNVYVADYVNHRIQKFTSDGAFITKWGSDGSGNGQFDRPLGIATDAAGNVYVADTGTTASRSSPPTAPLSPSGGARLRQRAVRLPQGIATDPAGNVYVADYVNHRIQKFTADGAFITKWGSRVEADGQF